MYYSWGGRDREPIMGAAWMGGPSWLQVAADQQHPSSHPSTSVDLVFVPPQLLGFVIIMLPTAVYLVIKQRKKKRSARTATNGAVMRSPSLQQRSKLVQLDRAASSDTWSSVDSATELSPGVLRN